MTTIEASERDWYNVGYVAVQVREEERLPVSRARDPAEAGGDADHPGGPLSKLSRH